MPGKNRGRAMSDKDKEVFLEMNKKKTKKSPTKQKVKMNRGGESKVRGTARGGGAATKGKGYNV